VFSSVVMTVVEILQNRLYKVGLRKGINSTAEMFAIATPS
jgi:hypothetical protein